MNKKIFNINNFKKIIATLKKKNKKIVLSHGVFDLLHIGHIKHFSFAKKHGEILIVSLTQDKFINKGIGRPIFNQNLRAEMLSSISIIDYVVINNENGANDILDLVKPNIYCKGIEYKNKKNDLTKKINLELSILKKNKGRVVFSNEDTYSSSKIINENFNLHDDSQLKILNYIKKKIPFEYIINSFEKMKKLKVLILGEIILDHYIFSEPIGKSSKDTMLVLKENNSKIFVGGAGSIAKNISNFTENDVEIISYIGEKKENSDIIKNYLGKKVKKFFLLKKNSPTITKKRYIDRINEIKLLGMYNFNNTDVLKKEEKKIIDHIKKIQHKFDMVLINDFSHGLVTKKIFNEINKSSNFVSLNTQSNSSNYGFFGMKNFKNLDCLSINERELRQELRDKFSDIKIIMKKLSIDKNLKNVLVTRGSDGVSLYNKKENKFYHCDAFAKNIVDKIGAGDTIHAIFSICLKCNIDYNLSLLISSLAAAENIKGFANEILAHPDQILKQLSHMLK